MLDKYQKQKIFYSLLEESRLFNNLKEDYIKMSKMVYDLSLSSLTKEETEFLKNNKSSVNGIDRVDFYNIELDNESSKYKIILPGFRSSIIGSDYSYLDKRLEGDKVIHDIISMCNTECLFIHNILELDKSIIIPDVANKMTDIDYLLDADKNGIFNFQEWINLLKEVDTIKKELRSRVYHLEKFLSLDYLILTELKSISPKLYNILKNK